MSLYLRRQQVWRESEGSGESSDVLHVIIMRRCDTTHVRSTFGSRPHLRTAYTILLNPYTRTLPNLSRLTPTELTTFARVRGTSYLDFNREWKNVTENFGSFLSPSNWIHGLNIKLSLHLRGSFQKFCTLYVCSLTMNLFYKIHLQAFNVISIVLYHSGPTFG
jgi:hypothetical protein